MSLNRIKLPRRPHWLDDDHPLFLHAAICKRIQKNFERNAIFLIIPFSGRYSKYKLAIISTVTAYDLIPRMATDRLRMETRILKIVELMFSCQFGFTDLSYVKRMNMPLELGLLLSFGRETFVTSSTRFGSLKSISDLNFADIRYYDGSVRKLISELATWIQQNCSDKHLSTKTLYTRYRRLKKIRDHLGNDFDRLMPEKIATLLGVAKDEIGLELPGS